MFPKWTLEHLWEAAPDGAKASLADMTAEKVYWVDKELDKNTFTHFWGFKLKATDQWHIYLKTNLRGHNYEYQMSNGVRHGLARWIASDGRVQTAFYKDGQKQKDGELSYDKEGNLVGLVPCRL